MIIFGPLLVIAGICFICWLLFTLAVFALPFFVGLTLGVWAFHSGAGVLGGILVGLFAGGATFGIGQFALGFVPWTWLRLLIILLFVAPAVVAGYSATYGSRTWRCRRRLGRRSSRSSARLPWVLPRSCDLPEWHRPDRPDRASRGPDTDQAERGRTRISLPASLFHRRWWLSLAVR